MLAGLRVVGKLSHIGAKQLSGSDYSIVDYNRAGGPRSAPTKARMLPLLTVLRIHPLMPAQPPFWPDAFFTSFRCGSVF